MSQDSVSSLEQDTLYKYYTEILADGQSEEEGHISDYSHLQDHVRYRSEDFISRPYYSPKCDIEENILEFDFSYGYDCKKPYNLVVIDEHTIVFASGNLIHFFNIDTLDIWVRRSAKGGGIGHITNNLIFTHLAVGENGRHPPIIIYDWPSLEIVTVLKGGTSKIYTHLNYSPTGELLVSQGGEPDYLITVWNWAKSTIMLRTRSYSNDVLRVMFSPYVPGHLTSSGVAHIKFWKIARTFTGLKLQGNLGRFGKTEYSDIVGIYPMADEKVISGCYWGNILVWDEGLIKLEVCRKLRKKCHDNAIVQFNYYNGELWTVSLDGHVKMWYYDTIDQADPPDEDRVCMMEPTYDFHTPGASFMSIAKQFQHDFEDTYYFAQDAKGAIWRIDLNIEEEAKPSERLYKSHAGATRGLAACPWGPYFTTIGVGGWVHLYNYLMRKLLMIILFPAPGTQMFWVPMEFDPSGEVTILGFGDGTIRIGVWKINEVDGKLSKIHIIQILKPHNKPVKIMSLNPTGTLFVTGGEDKTLFVFQVIREDHKYLRLIPIGYVPTRDVPVSLTWHNTKETILIIGCLHGQILIFDLPTEPVSYTRISYELQIAPISQKFHSYKSQVYRNILLKEIAAKREEKRAKKMVALHKLKVENPGLDIDEEVYLEDSESEEELPPLYYPEEPNKIHWIQHTEDNTLWVSMAGYDAGFIYEYQIGQSDPVPYKFQVVDGAENVDIGNYIYSKNKEYLIFAMMDGSIRVNRINKENWHDLSNYWSLNMHDNYNGYVAGIGFSYDHEYFLTSGNDGNVFAFKFNPGDVEFELSIPERIIPNLGDYELFDNVNCMDTLSLEENIVNVEVERINKLASQNIAAYMDDIRDIRERYEEILLENEKLPNSQKLTIEELTVDKRILDHLEDSLNSNLALVQRKYEFFVQKSKLRMEKMRKHFVESLDMYPMVVWSINTNKFIKVIKEHCLGDDFQDIKEMVARRIKEDTLRSRVPERTAAAPPRILTPEPVERKLEYFLLGLSPDIIENKLGAKINRMLSKYRAKKDWKENRKREWEIFNATKPSDTPLTEDEFLINEAKETIGDFKLKSAPKYKTPKQLRETTYHKYQQVLLLREDNYNMLHSTNLRVYNLRDQKKELHDELVQHSNRLAILHEEIVEHDRIEMPPIFTIDDDDYPERGLEINVNDKDKNTEPPIELVKVSEDVKQREVLISFEVDDEDMQPENAWENHIKQVRYYDLMYEQDLIIKTVKMATENFDNVHKRLQDDMISIRVEAHIKQLHILTLNQELLVLKECEEKEDYLSEKVNQKLQEYLDLQDELAAINNSLTMFKKEMDKLGEREKEINKLFLTVVVDNKFADFLKRIFRKKYKPPKIRTDDDSDSSSSSSSSDETEEDDAASIDSHNFMVALRLDENVCPKGCDANTYAMTFQLRGQRHEVESSIRDFQLQTEGKLKQKDLLSKKMRATESELKGRQSELESFQREKQQKLNQILCTVILKLNQMKHLHPDGGVNRICDSLVFSQKTLSGLYKRVGVLEEERRQQEAKHKLSITHLKRMESDFKVMDATIKKLKTRIIKELTIKFGSVIDVNELEEYQLKRMIYELRLSLSDVKGMFESEMAQLYEVHKTRQNTIIKMFKHNTATQDLLCLLRVEKAELEQTNAHQRKVKKNIEHILEQSKIITGELRKLNQVIIGQNSDIEALKNEIKLYKTKGFVIQKPQIETQAREPEDVEEEGSFVSEWSELDDYKYTEAYAKEYWTHKQTQEMRKTRQEVIFSIIEDLFKNINVKLREHTVAGLLQQIISRVMTTCDVDEIIKDIISVIPIKMLSEEQTSLIEISAQKIASFENIQEEEEVEEASSRDDWANIIDDIATDFMEKYDQTEDPVNILSALINNVVEKVPLSVAMDDLHMQLLFDKIIETLPNFHNIDKDTLKEVSISSLDSNIIVAEFLQFVLRTLEVRTDK